MGFLADYWLAIVVSGVAVFIVSSIIHMFVNWHKSDYQKLPAEADVLGAMREAGVKPGHYVFPCAPSMKEMGSDEMIQKYKQGPVGFLTVSPTGIPNMGKGLGQWFGYSILVSIFVAYVASFAAAESVFRLTSVVAFMVYGLSAMVDSIWKAISWGITERFIIDGLLYGVATGAVFAWLG